MKDIRLARWFTMMIPVLTLIAGMVLASTSQAQNSAASYGFAGSIPSLSLSDPNGKNFNPGQNNGRPTVIVVSVPNMSQGDIQKSWVNHLGSLPASINFFLVEDMKNIMFRDLVLGDMKSDYQEGDRPVVLLDNDGSARDQLGAPKGKTCVMIFNSGNRLVYVQVGNASPAALQAVNKAIAGLGN